ncbi:MAG: hypothetical protein D6694_00575 [Gammaproteobacteria bacterium]|nr:MAG: hypothetical protein D6694_00575 [Gammaproteobacteria bacterium]
MWGVGVMSRRNQVFKQVLYKFFRERLETCTAEHQVSPQYETICYLGDTLSRMAVTDELFVVETEGRVIRPLALLYKDAREADNEWEKRLLLQKLGEQALVTGALFPERWARKGLYQDYFVGMGSAAYDYLAEQPVPKQSVYRELAERFAALIELVMRACFRSPEKLEAILSEYRKRTKILEANSASPLGIDKISWNHGDLLH